MIQYAVESALNFLKSSIKQTWQIFAILG